MHAAEFAAGTMTIDIEKHLIGNFKKKKKKRLFFWTFCPPKRQNFKFDNLSEFLVVLRPKYDIFNKTTLEIHEKGQTKFFVKFSCWIVCANLINIQKMTNNLFFALYLTITKPLNHVFNFYSSMVIGT